MSYADLDLARWRRLDSAAARRLAAQVADDTGTELVVVRPSQYAGRSGRIALYRHDGALYALVAGGEVMVGYDGARFAPSPAQVADYAAWPVGDADIHAFVDDMTSPLRTVHVPALLVAVEAVEPGARPADLDDPRVREQLAYLQGNWEHYRPPGVISHQDWGRVELAVDGCCQLTSARLVEYAARDGVVADLAGRGLRLSTPDEWEHACGAGVVTLFRWGEDCPTDRYPTDHAGGPHRLRNAFGLAIGQNPYHCEQTADPAVNRGGDGGRALCGDYGFFLGWLTLATAYRDRLYDAPEDDEWHGDGDDDDVGQMFVRPVIQLG